MENNKICLMLCVTVLFLFPHKLSTPTASQVVTHFCRHFKHTSMFMLAGSKELLNLLIM